MQETCSKVPLPLLERKKESKEEALLATAKALDKRDLIYGFRTPAHHGPCHRLRAGVRKPPKNETAGGDARSSRDLSAYGDLRSARGGITMPGAGRGASRVIGDGREAKWEGRGRVAIRVIEWVR